MEKNRVEIKEKLKLILKNYVDIDNIELNEKMNLVSDVGLDSFALICMIGDIEREFNIKIETTVLSKIHTLGEIVDYVISKSNN